MPVGKESQILQSLQASLRLAEPGLRVLAVSGGLDSMVLLEAASRLVPCEHRGRLLILHINHQLRGDESLADEAFVLAAAAAKGLAVRGERLSWGKEKPSQQDARHAREKIYKELLTSPSDLLFLAHHLDDQAETIFFRLMRGTGLRGLGGMRVRSGQKMRPFLGFSKEELRLVAKAWGLHWREDSSNRSLRYERNWLRLEMLPQLEARRPGFARRLAALAEEAQAHSATPVSLPTFRFSEGVVLARPKRDLPLVRLRDAFSLSRAHCEALRELLGKPSGFLHAEKKKFHWSAGVLLLEEGGKRLPRGLSASVTTLTSVLGEWELGEERASKLWLAPSGDKAKKEFQARAVPLFLRPSLPMILERGRPRALHPSHLPQAVKFRPSALASWWILAHQQ